MPALSELQSDLWLLASFPWCCKTFFFKKCFKVLSVNIQVLLNGGIGYNCRDIGREIPQEGYGGSWKTKDKEKSSLELNQFSVARTLPFDPGLRFCFVFNSQISWPEKVWNPLTYRVMFIKWVPLDVFGFCSHNNQPIIGIEIHPGCEQN